MVKDVDFYDAQSECIILLSSIRMVAEYADRLIGFVSVSHEDEDGNVLKLAPCAEEHFATLQKTAKQLSSYSDRFNNKLLGLKKVIDHVNDITE